MSRFARVRVHAGRWMANNLPKETWVTVGAAGALPYAAGLRVFDVYGLVDPQISRLPAIKPQTGRHARPGHQLYAPRSYIRARDPDLLCHIGVVNKRRPGPRAAARRGYGRGYTWACVEPGPIADPREPDGVLDLGYYCCLRPKGREVGPFR
jgi:arabinofuranosyltransferase